MDVGEMEGGGEGGDWASTGGQLILCTAAAAAGFCTNKIYCVVNRPGVEANALLTPSQSILHYDGLL